MQFITVCIVDLGHNELLARSICMDYLIARFRFSHIRYYTVDHELEAKKTSAHCELLARQAFLQWGMSSCSYVRKFNFA